MRAGRQIMSNPLTTRKIRLYCDGELPPDEAASVARMLPEEPELGALADFERRLRQQVSEVLKTGSPPPPDLADRIRQALAAQDDTPGWDTETPAAQPAAAKVAGRIRPPAEQPGPHRPRWQPPVQANAFAVAASLVLVVGAVLFGIFGQDIDTVRGSRVDIAVETAVAVAGEHVTAVSGPARAARYDTPQLAADGLDEYLGTAGCVYDLTDLGYTFVGGDTCDVPHCDRGCHLVYRRTGSQLGMVTLHVLPEPKGLHLQGTAGIANFPIVTDVIGRNLNCPMDVLVWSHGDRYYLLSVCVPQHAEQIALRMQRALLARGG